MCKTESHVDTRERGGSRQARCRKQADMGSSVGNPEAADMGSSVVNPEAAESGTVRKRGGAIVVLLWLGAPQCWHP